MSLVRLVLFFVVRLRFGPISAANGPRLDPSFGMNPCYETKNWAHMQIFIPPSLHLAAGEGVWGRGRRLNPLLLSRNCFRVCGANGEAALSYEGHHRIATLRKPAAHVACCRQHREY
jgi:hypothetical protein